jgi:MftR C-terminal domain
VLSLVREGEAAFAQALAARPAGEDPLTAARNAFHISLRELSDRTGDIAPYLSVMRLIDSTPDLLAAHLRYIHDHDEAVIRVLAEREGVDPGTDLRPRLLAAAIGTLVFLANRDWRSGTTRDPKRSPPRSTRTPTSSSPRSAVTGGEGGLALTGH